MANLSLRKEIEYQEGLVNEQKHASKQNYDKIMQLREIENNMHKDVESQTKRVNILATEAENNN